MDSNMDIDWATLDATTIEEMLAYMAANPNPSLDAVEVPPTNDDSMLWDFTDYSAMLDDAIAANDLVDWELLQATDEDRVRQCVEPPRPPMGSTKNSSSHACKADSRCTWEGCKTKTIFKTERSYNNHLNNIHLKPLLCSFPRCSYKKPFRNLSDLNRHKTTRHSNERPYECPYPTCESETKRFARKDKWLQHIRDTQHLNDAFCPYHHCSSMTEFTSRKEISKHFNNCHSSYGDGYWAAHSCTLGACADNGEEHWGEDQLSTHLKTCHGMSKVDSFLVCYQPYNGDRKVHSVPDTVQWHDCTICGPAESNVL